MAPQDVIFTSDANQLKDVSTLKAPQRVALPENFERDPAVLNNLNIPVFKTGDAIFGALKLSDKIADMTPYTTQKDGTRIVRLVWSFFELSREGGNDFWVDLLRLEIPLTPEQLKKNNFTFTIIPDAYDVSAPGLTNFLARIPGIPKNNRKVLFRVRIMTPMVIRDGELFVESGFYIDLSGGAGRYADWLQDQKELNSQRYCLK